jgi:hypothetical protein
MGFERKIGRMVVGLSLLVAGTGAIGASSEPSTVLRLPDRAASFVPLPEPNLASDTASDQLYGNPSPEQALQEFGRAIGQAVQAQQQVIEAKCRSAQAAAASTTARWAWQANCGYHRH